MCSALPGFFKLSVEERIQKLEDGFGITDADKAALANSDLALPLSAVETMVENVIGKYSLPIGVATNFIIDGKEVLIPMATEEPSVIAGASYAAKLARSCGGFTTKSGSNICTGQIIVVPPSNYENPLSATERIKEDILRVANETMPSMVQRTGGAKKIIIRESKTESGPMIIIEIFIDVGDSMGANCITKACEACKDYIAITLGFEPLMGILTNLSQDRLVYAKATWKCSDLAVGDLDGHSVARRIKAACDLAKVDLTRASTHRKGIMNGITAVVIATGNDSRAVESDVHSYASIQGSNHALTNYYIDGDNLVGEINIPVTVGTVGGSINRNKVVSICRKLMKVESANDLARTLAAVGLAQNFAALRALVTTGILEGHIRLHSRNVASEAGAKGNEVEIIAQKLVQSKSVNVATAKALLTELRSAE